MLTNINKRDNELNIEEVEFILIKQVGIIIEDISKLKKKDIKNKLIDVLDLIERYNSEI
ncbi:MAG TPA: hypothetical protein VGB37_12690 [Candidatus Lokiarchaeia archaeon]